MTKQPIVLIVDGSNLAHRCRHTINVSYKGRDMSVLFGFIRILYYNMKRIGPNVVAVCWDGGVPKYRYDCCPSYKHHDRSDDETYADFLRQLVELQDELPNFGIASIRHKGAEADDLMYHAAKLLGGKKILLTSDQDLYQAVVDDKSGDTVVYSSTVEKEIGRSNFQDVTGVRLEDWMLYRCLVGDSSDGVPGCPGIGPVTASKLIANYSTATAIFNKARGIGDPQLPDMTESLSSKLTDFGMIGYISTMRAVRLDKDRCGVRRTLLREFRQWKHCNVTAVRQLIKRHMFISLAEPVFFDTLRALESPEDHLIDISHSQLRIPAVKPIRRQEGQWGS